MTPELLDELFKRYTSSDPEADASKDAVYAAAKNAAQLVVQAFMGCGKDPEDVVQAFMQAAGMFDMMRTHPGMGPQFADDFEDDLEVPPWVLVYPDPTVGPGQFAVRFSATSAAFLNHTAKCTVGPEDGVHAVAELAIDALPIDSAPAASITQLPEAPFMGLQPVNCGIFETWAGFGFDFGDGSMGFMIEVDLDALCS